MGKAARPRLGKHRLAGLGAAGVLAAASVLAVDRPAASAAPGAPSGPAHMNPTSWNPTDDNEPFESSGPYVFDSRLPDAARHGPFPRTGVGSIDQACRAALNTWAPIEPAYLNWRIKVESTDDYFAAEPEIDKLNSYLNTTHYAIEKALVGVPGYDSRADPIRKYDLNIRLFNEMADTGGGLAPLFPDVGIPWERWDAAWDNVTQSHDSVGAVCP